MTTEFQNEVEQETLQSQLQELADLEEELSGIEGKIERRDELLNILSKVDIRDILKARTVKVSTNGKTRATKESKVDEDLWQAIYAEVFKNGKNKKDVAFDSEARDKYLTAYNTKHKTNHSKRDMYTTIKKHAVANGVGGPTWNLRSDA